LLLLSRCCYTGGFRWATTEQQQQPTSSRVAAAAAATALLMAAICIEAQATRLAVRHFGKIG